MCYRIFEIVIIMIQIWPWVWRILIVCGILVASKIINIVEGKCESANFYYDTNYMNLCFLKKGHGEPLERETSTFGALASDRQTHVVSSFFWMLWQFIQDCVGFTPQLQSGGMLYCAPTDSLNVHLDRLQWLNYAAHCYGSRNVRTQF